MFVDWSVNKGDRIAQLILERIYIPVLEELPVTAFTFKGFAFALAICFLDQYNRFLSFYKTLIKKVSQLLYIVKYFISSLTIVF